jgi:hypothetical protein
MDSEGEFLIWTALAIFIPLTLSVMIDQVSKHKTKISLHGKESNSWKKYTRDWPAEAAST